MQNIHRCDCLVARSADLLENMSSISLSFNFWPKENSQDSSVTLAIDSDVLTNVVFEKGRNNDAAGQKSPPHSNYLRMQYLLVNLIWVSFVPYMAIVFVNTAILPKMRHVAKDLSAEIGALFETFRSPVRDQTALSMVNYFELLSWLDLVRM